MQIIETKQELRRVINSARRSNHSIGFVPTMGYLHEGHLSLMRRARRENDLVVTSVFVNPAQFGPREDLDTYPRNDARDKELMLKERVDIAFFPTVSELYPDGYSTYVEVKGSLTQGLCGRSRPRFFRGVTTIVAKLFHLVTPDRAYFGAKDAQQSAVVRQMVKDLDFNLKIVVCPTVREADGLAMSSRNSYLSPQHRTDAVVISKSLESARQMIADGERNAHKIYQSIKREIDKVPDAIIDYIAVVDAMTLVDVKTLNGEILIAAAIKLAGTRLIDNIQIKL
ncbi:MAG: pantoate--beta-alanine ligase [Desulfobacteraceae bacterium]|jgi:pantoate--beta-alanine ligase